LSSLSVEQHSVTVTHDESHTNLSRKLELAAGAAGERDRDSARGTARKWTAARNHKTRGTLPSE
jgi:hypothetical protein